MGVKLIISILLLSQFISACPDEKNCAHCKYFDHGQNFCGKCYNSVYSKNTHKCETNGSTLHCIEYTEIGVPECIRCKFGFGLTNKKECIQCTKPNCAICNDDVSNCASYFDGTFGLVTGEEGISTVENCKDPNCDVCDNLYGFCLKCKNSFSLNSTSFICQTGLKGCEILNWQNGNKCNICESTHYLSKDGTCKLNSEFNDYTNTSKYVGVFVAIVIVLIVLGVCYFLMKKKTQSTSVNRPINGGMYSPI